MADVQPESGPEPATTRSSRASSSTTSTRRSGGRAVRGDARHRPRAGHRRARPVPRRLPARRGRLRQLPQAGPAPRWTTRSPAPSGALVERLLPVLDACDGALAHGATEVEPIVAALLGALEKEGLVRVDPIGEVFDPTVAEAVVHEPGDGGDHIVSEVMRAGLHVAGPGAPPRHGQGHGLTRARTEVRWRRSASGSRRTTTASSACRSTASAKEIKSAYRKLSRQYHPDANPGDAAAEERFKEVSAAYDVVGNAERRKEYDEVRRLGSGRGRVPRRGGGPGGFSVPGRRRPRRPARRPVRPRSGAAAVGAAAGAARTAARTSRRSSTSPSTTPSPGVTTTVHLTSDAPCHTCNGSGRQARHRARTRCANCGGQGVVSDNQGLFSLLVAVPGVRRPRRHDRRSVPDLPGHRRRAPPARGQGAHPRRASTTASASG